MDILVLNDLPIKVGKPESYYAEAHDYTEDSFTQVLYQDDFEKALLSQAWDEVFLDHDLGLDDFNGKIATRRIQEGVMALDWDLRVGRFIVTSFNPHSAKQMVSDLRRVDLNAVAIVTDRIAGIGYNPGLFVPEGGFR